MINPSALYIVKVNNGYIIKEPSVSGMLNAELAVFNDVTDMCHWLKANFAIEAEEQPS